MGDLIERLRERGGDLHATHGEHGAAMCNEATDEIERIKRDAGRLLDEALYHLDRTYHEDDCPRSRDDYDCTCGLSDVKEHIREWLRNGQ